MNILLCVKQVPDTADIRIDPVKNVLIRKGVPSILNPFDSYALEAAARIKDKDPATKIVALSMGPTQADAVLRECLAIAADSAYLVSGTCLTHNRIFICYFSPFITAVPVQGRGRARQRRWHTVRSSWISGRRSRASRRRHP